jgi:hypothetical protein
VPSRNPWAIAALAAAVVALAQPLTIAATLVDLKWLVGSLQERLLERVAAVPVYYFGVATAIALAAVTLAALALRHPAARSRHAAGKTPALAALVVGLAAVLTAPFAFTIVVPSVFRANDHLALGDVREIGATQRLYAEYNAGGYATLECLGAPERCLQGSFPQALRVPAPRLAGERFGHRRRLNVGTRTFAYVSVPVQQGMTAERGYCTDHTGVMCVLRGAEAPSLENGACPRSACARELPF